jgi:choline dehydrogenase-like flavoprotein
LGFDRAASKLRRDGETFHPPLALRYQSGDNGLGRQLKACNGCGRCCLGCPNEAKNSLDHNYLHVAEQYPNVRIKTRAEARYVHAARTGYRIEYDDALSGRSYEASAKRVFLCAGSLGTTQLLARSAALARREAARGLVNVSSQLGKSYFANGDAVSLVFDAEQAHEPTRGPTITTSTMHRDEHGFVLVQDGGYPVEMARFAAAFAAPAWLGKNRFRSGASTARPSSNAPLAAKIEGAEAFESAVGSPLDALTRAVQSGALDASVPEQLQQAVAALKAELLRDTRGEFEALVDGMIERSLRELLARASRRRLKAGTFLHDKALGLLRKVTLDYLTDKNELATFAQRAFFERFGLLASSQVLPQTLARALGGNLTHAASGTVLLAMGQDTAKGELRYDAERDELSASPATARGFDVLAVGERLQRDLADAMAGELRTSPVVSLLGKPMTVHSQGGCGMAASPAAGVTTPEGELHGHPGLFVLDTAAFPGSVGVNPSATALAVAERNVLGFIRAAKGNPDWPNGDDSQGAREFAAQRAKSRVWARNVAKTFTLAPPVTRSRPLASEPVGLTFGEVFSGFLAPSPQPVEREADYYALETAGRSLGQCVLELRIEITDLDRFWRDPERRARLGGNAQLVWPDGKRREDCNIEGELQLLVEGALVPQLRGAPRDRYFLYDMRLCAADGELARMRMYKRMPRAMNRLAWRGTSRCYTRIEAQGSEWAGIVRVDLSRFIFRTLPSMQVTGTKDPARIAWALGDFAKYFVGGFGAAAPP